MITEEFVKSKSFDMFCNWVCQQSFRVDNAIKKVSACHKASISEIGIDYDHFSYSMDVNVESFVCGGKLFFDKTLFENDCNWNLYVVKITGSWPYVFCNLEVEEMPIGQRILEEL